MELSGELTGIGLRPLVRFLSDLKKSGILLIHEDRWTGTLGLVDGHIVGANFADEQGLAALDAIFFALQHGSFEFNSRADCEHNVLVQPWELAEHLDSLDAEIGQLGNLVTSLSAVPAHTEVIPDREFALTRTSISLLLAVDGRRTVADHARERGLLATLRELAVLLQLGLVTMQTQAPAPALRPPARSAPVASAAPAPTNGADATSPRANFWRRA